MYSMDCYYVMELFSHSYLFRDMCQNGLAVMINFQNWEENVPYTLCLSGRGHLHLGVICQNEFIAEKEAHL